MSTPHYPPSNPDPSASFPPPGSYPAPGSYPPPAAGSYPPPAPGSYPPPAPGSYPPPSDAGGYPPPPPAGSAYPVGQPGAYPPPPGVMPPKPKSKARLITLIVVLVVVVVGGVTAYLYSKKHDTAQAKVGDCVQVKSVSADNADTNQIACTDPAATYIVTQVGDSSLTCDTAEATYTETKGSDVKSTVCLRPNLAVGDCWKEGASTEPSVKYLGCANVPATDKSDTNKLLKLDTTSSSDSACPSGTTLTLPLPTRMMIYCFGDVS